MSVIYPFMKVMSGEENPNLKELENMDPKKAMRYLMKPEKMKGKYLGACLDSCRWGSMTTVMWETDIRGLMGFIQKWREENNDNLELYHEMPIGDLYIKFELPHINHEHCPRDKKHLGTVLDSGGRVRCGHRTVKRFKPSFISEFDSFDELSQMKTKEFYEEKPSNPSYEDDDGEIVYPEEEWPEYLNAMHKYHSEEETEEVVDVCYAVISDKNLILPFETVLRRLNLAPATKTVYCGNYMFDRPCRRLNEVEPAIRYRYMEHCEGHKQPNNEVVFPFDGWDLAYYLQRWREQVPDAKAPWFAEKQEHWKPKPIPCYD